MKKYIFLFITIIIIAALFYVFFRIQQPTKMISQAPESQAPESQTPESQIPESQTVKKFPPLASSLSAASGCGVSCKILLGWKFSDKDDDPLTPEYEDYLSAYQVEVGENENFEKLLYDSEKISTKSTNHPDYPIITYPIKELPLSSSGKYYWRIKVWDSANISSNWIQGGKILF